MTDSCVNGNVLTLTHILQTRDVLNDEHKAFLFSTNPSLGVHIHQECPPPQPDPMSGPVSPRHCLSRKDAPSWVARTWSFTCRAVLPSPPVGERAVAIARCEFSGYSSDCSSWEVGGVGGREGDTIAVEQILSFKGR